MLRKHSLNIVEDVSEVADNRNFDEVFDTAIPNGSDIGTEQFKHTAKNTKSVGLLSAFSKFLNSVRSTNNRKASPTVRKLDTNKNSETFGSYIEVTNLDYNPNLFEIESSIQTYLLVSKGKVSVEQKAIENFAKEVSAAIGFRDYPSSENIAYAFARLSEVFERTNLFITQEVLNELSDTVTVEQAETAMAAAL